jgi:phosphoadenosine phosphosulfate reductase
MPAVVTEDQITQLQQEFYDASPQAILRYAVETFGDELVVVTSFQTTGIVTLHMLKEITDNINVVTLDTGVLFPETYQLIETLEQQLDISVELIKPQQTLTQQAKTYGSLLWESDPNQCCHFRKTIPLRETLSQYSAWVTGIRRDQSSTRANAPTIAWDERYNLVKLCPFATWTEDMIWTYMEAYELPYNPLHERGYSSIGCYTCTVAAAGREGRWSSRSKTECGIHIPLVAEEKAG